MLLERRWSISCTLAAVQWAKCWLMYLKKQRQNDESVLASCHENLNVAFTKIECNFINILFTMQCEFSNFRLQLSKNFCFGCFLLVFWTSEGSFLSWAKIVICKCEYFCYVVCTYLVQRKVIWWWNCVNALKSNQARAKRSLLPPNIKKFQPFFLIDGSLLGHSELFP